MISLKESIQILQACEDVQESGLIFGTWGNLSVLLEDGNILITPSGIPYDELREEDLVICDMNGNVVMGKQEPSSELKMHVEIYKARKDVRAIVHTHSLYASVASATLSSVPLIVEDAAMVLGGAIEVTSYQAPGTQELALEATKHLGQKNAVIIANHGQVGVGATLDDAILSSVMCEKSSQLYIKALEVTKSPRVLSDDDVKKLNDVYVSHYRRLRDFKNE
jgi:L-fuculose-phosphate aldolase